MRQMLCGLMLLLSLQLNAVTTIKEGPIHEAFLEKISSLPLASGIEKEPPKPIVEKVFPPQDERAQWIEGYWEWSKERNDFIWISGVWRVPPPDMHWIPTKWQKIEDLWVRAAGFWSSHNEDSLDFISEMPPEPVEEDVGVAPDANSFWSAGFWKYDDEKNQYAWVSGKWIAFDPNWILVPSHYVWRSEGNVFVPAYWDWPLDKRGVVFIPLFFDADARSNEVVFEPSIVVEHFIILQRYFLEYPDYLYLYSHHYHYHPEYWSGIAPTWWQWPSWWSFTWNNQWALWWWYTHPGYPQPSWMSESLSQKIEPPSNELLSIAKKAKPPFIVTTKGVVDPEKFLKGKEKLLEKKGPILPASSDVLDRIKGIVEPKVSDRLKTLKPIGKPIYRKLDFKDQPLKPALSPQEKKAIKEEVKLEVKEKDGEHEKTQSDAKPLEAPTPKPTIEPIEKRTVLDTPSSVEKKIIPPPVQKEQSTPPKPMPNPAEKKVKVETPAVPKEQITPPKPVVEKVDEVVTPPAELKPVPIEKKLESIDSSKKEKIVKRALAQLKQLE